MDLIDITKVSIIKKTTYLNEMDVNSFSVIFRLRGMEKEAKTSEVNQWRFPRQEILGCMLQVSYFDNHELDQSGCTFTFQIT